MKRKQIKILSATYAVNNVRVALMCMGGLFILAIAIVVFIYLTFINYVKGNG
jgi:hypothetical protein